MLLLSSSKLAWVTSLLAFFIFIGCRGNNNQTDNQTESLTQAGSSTAQDPNSVPPDTAFLNEELNNNLKVTFVKLEINKQKVKSLSEAIEKSLSLKQKRGKFDHPRDFWIKEHMFTTGGFLGGFIAQYDKENQTMLNVYNEVITGSVVCFSSEGLMTAKQHKDATVYGSYLKLNYFFQSSNTKNSNVKQTRYLIYTKDNPFSWWAFWQKVPDFYSHRVTIKEFEIYIKKINKSEERLLSNKLQCFMSSENKSPFTWRSVQEALKHVARMSKLPEE